LLDRTGLARFASGARFGGGTKRTSFDKHAIGGEKDPMTPEELRARIASEIGKRRHLVKVAGIRVEP
jgi:hypothetical protein